MNQEWCRSLDEGIKEAVLTMSYSPIIAAAMSPVLGMMYDKVRPGSILSLTYSLMCRLINHVTCISVLCAILRRYRLVFVLL
jgi:hypothetical protein